MFDKIGQKIKILAKLFCWFNIIINIIAAVILFIEADNIPSLRGIFITAGLIALIAGPLFSWISSFVLYGFGQLVENSDTLAGTAPPVKKQNNNYKINTLHPIVSRPKKASEKEDDYVDLICPGCKETLSFEKDFIGSGADLTCPYCGNKIRRI